MPAPTTRDQIAQALFNLALGAASGVTPIVTSGRRLIDYQTVDSTQMPALFLVQLPELVELLPAARTNIPPKRQMHFEIWIYTCDPLEQTVVPISQLNAMVDAIEAALALDPMTNTQTLGGLVAAARIEGTIQYADNLVGGSKSAAIIPVTAVRP